MQRERPKKDDPPPWAKVEEGKTYSRKIRNPRTGEWMKKEVTVTKKQENSTLDGSEGAKILVIQYERKRRSG